MPAIRALRPWLVWAVAVLAYVMAVVGRSSFAATGVTAAQRFEVSAGVLSLLAVVQLAVYAGLQIPAGILVDRFGPRRLIGTGAVLVGIGQAVLALAPGFAVAVGGRMLAGAGDAMTFVSILRLIPAWFPARRVPVLNQFAGILGQLGQVVSAVPLAALVGLAGWTPAYLAAAGTALLTAVLVAAVVRNGPVATAPSSGPGPAAGGFAAVLRSPGTRLGFWCHFTAPFPGNVFGLLWGFPFLTAGEGLDGGTARALLALYVVAGIAAGPVFGTLAARFPRRRAMLIAGAVLAQAAAWSAVLAWPGAAPIPLLVAFATLLGLGGPASLVAFDLARAAVAPSQIGRASGMVNVGGFVSTITVVVLVGVVLDLQGAGEPALGTPAALRDAMLVHLPVWVLGLTMIARAARRVARPDASLNARSDAECPQ